MPVTVSPDTPRPPGGTPAGRSPRVEHDGSQPVVLGVPVAIEELRGRILFDDFEDVFAMDPDGSDLVAVAGDAAGPEFDGAWSPDGEWVVYRDSTRGINENDEIFVARADGSERRNISNHRANDWGPDWSPDGSTIAFNSDRDGGVRGYLMDPDGEDVRRLPIDGWVEYPAFSPDGTQIAYMSALATSYELFVADVATGDARQLTTSPRHDGWPAWSPDGSTIAFTTERDDCEVAPPELECWRTGDDGIHYDVWLVMPDGSDLRRATPEFGQFVAWSPDGRNLLVSGYSLYVIRPDGTGRLELRAEGIPRAIGGIPDWWAPPQAG